MNKVLSQDEIDALLAESGTPDVQVPLTSGDSTSAVLTYDFKHPNRVSKDQIRVLESIHKHVAGRMSSSLSAMMRAVVDVDLLSVDQITYAEFISSLGQHPCTYTFQMTPLEGLCIADYSPALAFGFVDRMFGGRGKGMAAEREITGIELSVMEKVSSRAYRELSEGWSRLFEVAVAPSSIEANPQFVQVVPAGETVLVINLEIAMLEVKGVLRFCYPFMTLEPALTKMSGQNWFEATRAGAIAQNQETVRENLRRVTTDVSAVLAGTAITMRDFLSIEEGDIIITDTETTMPTRILVGGVEKFMARPGARGKRRAIEIVGISDIEYETE